MLTSKLEKVRCESSGGINYSLSSPGGTGAEYLEGQSGSNECSRLTTFMENLGHGRMSTSSSKAIG